MLQARPSRSLMGKIALWGAVYLVLLVGLLAVGHYIPLPDADLALTPAGGALAASAHVLTGQSGGTDFLLDYASAVALRDGVDPYSSLDILIGRVGEQWPVLHANPHPPTILGLVLPFTLVNYQWALAAWSLAMVGALIATLRLVDVPLKLAIVVGVGMALVWPGAYAIGNVVPLIGLGAAVAWRWRDNPTVAGAGVALGVAPKISGLLLAIPFLLTGRVRAVVWAAALTGALAVIPVAFNNGVWAGYLDAGVAAIDVNMAREDNGSLLQQGVPVLVVVFALASGAIVLAIRSRDIYWPTVWLMVATLPIGWMYSLVTLIPAMARSLRYPRAVVSVILAVAVMIGSSPSGLWPTVTFPVVIALSYLALWWTPDIGFPLPQIERELTTSGPDQTLDTA